MANYSVRLLEFFGYRFIGDVASHCIFSALLMATVRSSLRQRASLSGSTVKINSDVNRQFV